MVDDPPPDAPPPAIDDPEGNTATADTNAAAAAAAANASANATAQGLDNSQTQGQDSSAPGPDAAAAAGVAAASTTSEGMTNDADASGAGGSGGGAGGGDGSLLITYTLDRLKPAQEKRAKVFWARFRQYYREMLPDAMEQNYALYQGTARQILDQVDQLPEADQKAVQQFIFTKLIEPAGKTLERSEVMEAYQNLVKTTITLAKKFNVPVPKPHGAAPKSKGSRSYVV
jgi:hypothetical protein